MSELSNYSIETDHSVWLSFKDGHNLRVSVNQLPRYLTPHDLQKVRRAMKLRRDFFRNHMPKTLLVAAVIGLTALAVTSGQMLASYWQERNLFNPSPLQREVVRGAGPLTPGAPTPATSATTAKLPATTTAQTAGHTASKPQPVPTLPAVAPRYIRNSAVATPIAQPGADPKDAAKPSPTPAPTPLPTPLPTPASDLPSDVAPTGESSEPIL